MPFVDTITPPGSANPILGFLNPTGLLGAAYKAVDRDFMVCNATATYTLPAVGLGKIVGATVRSAGLTCTIASAGGSIFFNSGAGSPGSLVLDQRGQTVILVCDGTNWFCFGGAQQSWSTVALAGAWASTGGIRTRRMPDGQLYVRGTLTTLDASGTTVLTLPAGQRPIAAWGPASIQTNTITLAASVTVSTGGVLVVSYAAGATSVCLDGLSFVADL